MFAHCTQRGGEKAILRAFVCVLTADSSVHASCIEAFQGRNADRKLLIFGPPQRRMEGLACVLDQGPILRASPILYDYVN